MWKMLEEANAIRDGSSRRFAKLVTPEPNWSGIEKTHMIPIKNTREYLSHLCRYIQQLRISERYKSSKEEADNMKTSATMDLSLKALPNSLLDCHSN